jgi:predicted GNAT family N-acyltransferase
LAPLIRTTKTKAELLACLALRRRVFIEEQGVPEADELDALDPVCAHFLAWEANGGPAVGTARLWITPEGTAKAQRVAVLPFARGEGIGAALMAAVEEEARRRGHKELVLGAQLSAVPFYERLGYEGYGEVFDDAGIPHWMMRRAL